MSLLLAEENKLYRKYAKTALYSGNVIDIEKIEKYNKLFKNTQPDRILSGRKKSFTQKEYLIYI